MSRRTTVSLLIIGLLLVVGAPATWWALHPPASIGDLEALDLPTADTPLEDAPSDDSPAPDDGPDAVDLDYSSTPVTGRLENLARPARVAAPRVGIDAPVDPVGIEPNGEMEIPDDVARTGWFEPGVRPGHNGTAVLAGHVDSRAQGRGAFYQLRELAVDDLIVVTGEDGEAHSWRVVGRTSYGKTDIPLEDIFVQSGEPRLALITCGGPFDREAGSYEQNVVVYAVPA